MPVHVLGGGSNIIVPDEGVAGLVVHVVSAGVRMTASGRHTLVEAKAGEAWDPLVERCVEEGLGGIECLSGIPGRTGATPIQNVGAYGQEVAQVIDTVTVLDRSSLEERVITGDACGFRYRQSRFKGTDAGRFIVMAVRFRLIRGAEPEVRYPELARAIAQEAEGGPLPPGAEGLLRVRSAVLGLRKRKSMVLDPADPNSRSVGSFFMNPVLTPPLFAALQERWTSAGGDLPVPSFPAGEEIKVPAAWLVEQAGFPKGTRRGGVGVSANHALALVNFGGTTRELLALASGIEQAVLERFGVRLEREPVLFA
jgi:UDP-N-acetylmuramate dehydrogenase